jgi:hypothetical protein
LGKTISWLNFYVAAKYFKYFYPHSKPIRLDLPQNILSLQNLNADVSLFQIFPHCYQNVSGMETMWTKQQNQNTASQLLVPGNME